MCVADRPVHVLAVGAPNRELTADVGELVFGKVDVSPTVICGAAPPSHGIDIV